MATAIITNATVDVVRRELDRIKRERGTVTNLAIVEAARPAGSALHAFFEWDDGAAAEKYRLLQAGQLVQSVRVFVAGGGEPRGSTVRVVPERKVPGPSLPRARPSDQPNALARARAALEAWVRDYGRVSGAAKADVERAIDRIRRMEDPRAQVRTG